MSGASGDTFTLGSRAASGSSANTRSTARCQAAAAVAGSAAVDSRRNSVIRSMQVFPPVRQRLTTAVRPPAASRSVAATNTSSPGRAGGASSPLAIDVCSPGRRIRCGRFRGGASQSPNDTAPLPAPRGTSGQEATGPSPASSAKIARLSHTAAATGIGSGPPGASGVTRSIAAVTWASTASASAGFSLRSIRPTCTPTGPGRCASNGITARLRVGA